MPLYNKIADDITEVDIIIAGGGAAGCVVASRLAAADTSLSILLIEGGESNYMKDNVINPALFREHLYPGSRTAIFYSGTKQPQLADREPVIITGGLLGGGTSINIMLYSRALRNDFDSWNTEGWTADDLMSHIKGLETFHVNGSAKVHGQDGPVHISDGGYRIESTDADILQAAKKLGYEVYEDLSDLEGKNGFAAAPGFVNPSGKRQDAAHTYLHPLLQTGQYPNLHVLCQAKVNRVLFDDNKRAVGVEYLPNPEYQPAINGASAVKTQVRARRLVVVSSGSCASPAILERSGVGQADLLNQYGIPVISDLYGVGHDYQDHQLMFTGFRSNLAEHQTHDALFNGKINRDEAIAKKLDILGWNGCDIAGKIRPTDAEAKALGPDFEAAWNRDFAPYPDRPLMLMAICSSYMGDPDLVEPEQHISAALYTAYPYSRGSIHIRGTEWSDGVDLDVGYFNDKNDIDLKAQLWAYKKSRELLRRTELYKGELDFMKPKFPAGSAAAYANLNERNGVNGHYQTDSARIQDIVYTAADDEAIIQYLRENITTTWHSLGTCKMAPREENGVLDKDLNVHGVSGLKVCDLSIAPKNVAANTMNTALIIGEKGASIIMKELGLKPVGNGVYRDLKLEYP